jgi:putative ABC transport system substrate-binding protein
MRRREFIAATAALLVPPRRSLAQGTRRRLGVLGYGERVPTMHKALLDGLRNHGWIDGRNLIIEYRYAQSQDRLPALAAELRSQPRSAHRRQPTNSRSPEIGNR